MSGRPGRPGTPGSGPSRSSGPGGPRRPGGPRGNNDNVLPLITGVLGSSILAFSLYVFSQNPGLLGEIVHGADDGPDYPSVSDPSEPGAMASEPCAAPCQPACEYYQPCDELRQPVIQTYQMSREACQPAVEAEPAKPGPKISIEKKKWLTEREEETIKDRRLKERQERGKLQKELSEHLQKVKEIRDELHKERKTKKPWE